MSLPERSKPTIVLEIRSRQLGAISKKLRTCPVEQLGYWWQKYEEWKANARTPLNGSEG